MSGGLILMVVAFSVVNIGLPISVSEPANHGFAEETKALTKRVERLELLILRQHSKLRHQEKVVRSLKNERNLLKDRILLLEDRVREMEGKDSDSTKCSDVELKPVFTAAEKPGKSVNKTIQKQRQALSADQSKQSGTEVSKTPHTAVRRSDDLDRPWEPLLGQMNQQLTEMASQIQAQKNVNLQQDQAIQDSQSSLYVRWGRSSCPASSQLVYSGVIGGSNYGDSGGATDYLCLSMSPVGGHIQRQSYHASLYGAELETYDNNANRDPVCSVCRPPRPTTVMLPGTNKCLSGWTTEYTGYLMTGYTSSSAGSEYICVDVHPEVRVGSEADKNGKLLYYTFSVCGSLPCPPYSDDTVVTCAVCSK